MRTKLIFLFCCLTLNNCVSSLQLLYVACFPSHSHGIWHGVLAEGLVDKGHNVTYLGCQTSHIPIHHENFTLIYVEGVFEKLDSDSNMTDVILKSPLEVIFEMKDWDRLSCRAMHESKGLQQLLRYPSDFFDAIVMDITLPCLLPFIEKFNFPPTVGATPFQLSPFVSHFCGNSIQHTSYVPLLGLGYTDKMNFWQRLENAFLTYTEVFTKFSVNPEIVQSANQIFGTKSSFGDLIDHISIVLTNIDPVLNYPQALAPNYIPVGGLHVKAPKKLPEDLQKILDDSTNGVVVMSLGSNLRSDDLGDTKIKAFLNAFARLNQTVVWKFESELTNAPKNVLVRPWLSQSDILAHPNVKLFIGHGGALSTYEAEIHGVPIIVLPFFLDQFNSMALVVKRNLGMFMDSKQTDSADYIYDTITKLLNNATYTENAKEVSFRYKSQPLLPLEKALLYIDYTIKNNGTKFLSTSARTLPFFVSEKLDIFLFLFMVLIFTMYVLKSTTGFLLNLGKGGKKKVKTN